MSNSDKMNVAIIYPTTAWINPDIGWCVQFPPTTSHWGIGMSANDRGRWSEWSGTCEVFLKNQGNTKETMSSSKQSITIYY